MFTTKENEVRKYSVLAVVNYDVSTMNDFNIYNITATSTYIDKIEELINKQPILFSFWLNEWLK